jgi:hypothetical protein
MNFLSQLFDGMRQPSTCLVNVCPYRSISFTPCDGTQYLAKSKRHIMSPGPFKFSQERVTDLLKISALYSADCERRVEPWMRRRFAKIGPRSKLATSEP